MEVQAMDGVHDNDKNDKPNSSHSFLFEKFANSLSSIRESSKKAVEMRELYKTLESFTDDLSSVKKLLRVSDADGINFGAGIATLKRYISKASLIENVPLKHGNVYDTLIFYAEMVNQRCYAKTRPISLHDVNELLHLYQSTKDEKHLRVLFQNCTTKELVWIFAIIINAVPKCLLWSHSAIRKAIFPNSQFELNRQEEASEMTDRPPNYPLFHNFAPMLLYRSPQANWWPLISNVTPSGFYMETKYDGEHVLIHRSNGAYKIFTRNGKDFTKYYNGSDAQLKNMVQTVDPYFIPEKNFVVDCEIVLYDEVAKQIVRHNRACSDGETYSFRNISRASPVHLIVIAFDVLFFDGFSLLNQPLSDRVKCLKIVLRKEDPTIAFISPRIMGNTQEDIIQFFKKAMQNDEEGIVVKNIDAPYCIGSRALTNGFFKIKANMVDGATIDAAIVGMREIDGEKLYVVALKANATAKSTSLKVIGNAKLGMIKAEKDFLFEECLARNFHNKEPPTGITGPTILGKYGYFEKSDNAIAVQIRTLGVVNGHLEHPIIVGIRVDKDLCDLDNVEDFEKINQEIAQGCLNEFDEIANNHRKNDKVSKSALLKKANDKQLLTSINRASQNMRLYIPSTAEDEVAKAEIKRLGDIVLKLHGHLSQAINKHLTAVIVHDFAKREQIDSLFGKVTLIRSSWLDRCKESNAFVEWLPNEIVHEKKS